MTVLTPVTGSSTAIVVDQEPEWLGEALVIRTGERIRIHSVRRDGDRVLLAVSRGVGEYRVTHSVNTTLQGGDDLMLMPRE